MYRLSHDFLQLLMIKKHIIFYNKLIMMIFVYSHESEDAKYFAVCSQVFLNHALLLLFLKYFVAQEIAFFYSCLI